MSSRSVLLLNFFYPQEPVFVPWVPFPEPRAVSWPRFGGLRAALWLASSSPHPPGPAGSSFLYLLQSACPAPARGVLGVPLWGDQDISPGNPEAGSSQVAAFPEAPLPRLLPVLLTHPPSEFPFCLEASLLSTMPGIPDLGAPESHRAGGSHGYRVGVPTRAHLSCSLVTLFAPMAPDTHCPPPPALCGSFMQPPALVTFSRGSPSQPHVTDCVCVRECECVPASVCTCECEPVRVCVCTTSEREPVCPRVSVSLQVSVECVCPARGPV